VRQTNNKICSKIDTQELCFLIVHYSEIYFKSYPGDWTGIANVSRKWLNFRISVLSVCTITGYHAIHIVSINGLAAGCS
jgi:hypothetical protein